MILAALFGAALGGLGSYIASSGRSKSEKAQAQQLRRNLATMQAEVEKLIAEGKINLDEALQRIDTLISTTKGELREVMEKQVDLAVSDMKDRYGTALKTGMSNIRQDLGQRRLYGSQAGQEIRGKFATGLAEKESKDVSNLRERALNALSTQLSQLSLAGGQMKEGRIAGFEKMSTNLRLGSLQQALQIGSMADTLDRQSQESPWGEIIGGAVEGGLPALLAGFFTPGGSTVQGASTASPTNDFKLKYERLGSKFIGG